MPEEIRIIGVHRIPANDPCHLVEIELTATLKEFDFGSITQEMPDQPRNNWQVAYDEQKVGGDGRWRFVFFFHYLDSNRPLLTPLGPISIPDPTPLPDYLKEIQYYEP